MTTSRVEPIKWQDGYGGQQFSYTPGASHTSTSLPPVNGHVSGVDNYARRKLGKLPEWSRYSDSQLSSKLPDCKEMSLPELTGQTQMTMTRRPRAVATTQRVKEPRMKNWSSELPAYNCRSYNVPGTVSENSTSHQHLSTSTTLRRSSSMRGPLIDASMTPLIVRKASISMDNLTDKHCLVNIILVYIRQIMYYT